MCLHCFRFCWQQVANFIFLCHCAKQRIKLSCLCALMICLICQHFCKILLTLQGCTRSLCVATKGKSYHRLHHLNATAVLHRTQNSCVGHFEHNPSRAESLVELLLELHKKPLCGEKREILSQIAFKCENYFVLHSNKLD